VFRGDTTIAIIDWNADVAPGRRNAPLRSTTVMYGPPVRLKLAWHRRPRFLASRHFGQPTGVAIRRDRDFGARGLMKVVGVRVRVTDGPSNRAATAPGYARLLAERLDQVGSVLESTPVVAWSYAASIAYRAGWTTSTS
jgi:hypothetical protein